MLSELTLLLKGQVESSNGLCLVDAHAMSPYATRDAKPGQSARVFEVVRRSLPGQGSAYEQAWLELVSQHHPTTAMFVRHLWSGPLSMVLCDIDKATIDDISTWKKGVPDERSIEPWRGDWARRLRSDVPEAAACLVSFDPYMVIRENASAPTAGHMYPADLSGPQPP